MQVRQKRGLEARKTLWPLIYLQKRGEWHQVYVEKSSSIKAEIGRVEGGSSKLHRRKDGLYALLVFRLFTMSQTRVNSFYI